MLPSMLLSRCFATRAPKMSYSWPKVILFGDSHTQRGFDPSNGCWCSMLANKLLRTCDVVQRGFSGYNTRSCRLLMPKVFEEFENKKVACVTILLGSNDAVDPESPTNQHVPLDEYKSNLKSMIEFLESKGISRDRLILMTPPNYFHETFLACCRAENRPKLPINSNDNMKRYAEACKAVAVEQGVTLLDLFPLFSSQPNSEQLFSDGLHMSFAGGKLLFDHLHPLVIEKLEKFTGKSFEEQFKFPYWADIDHDNLEKCLFAQQ